jgi:hypothetical protein
MGYSNRDEPARKSGRAVFVDARLEEFRRRWENATDEREKTQASEQIREWQSFRPERSAPSGRRQFSVAKAWVVEDIKLRNVLWLLPLQNMKFPITTNARVRTAAVTIANTNQFPRRARD